jgi:hypothetical protein
LALYEIYMMKMNGRRTKAFLITILVLLIQSKHFFVFT